MWLNGKIFALHIYDLKLNPHPSKTKKKKSLEFTHFFPIILFSILLFFTIDLRFDLLFNFGGAKN